MLRVFYVISLFTMVVSSKSICDSVTIQRNSLLNVYYHTTYITLLKIGFQFISQTLSSQLIQDKNAKTLAYCLVSSQVLYFTFCFIFVL